MTTTLPSTVTRRRATWLLPAFAVLALGCIADEPEVGRSQEAVANAKAISISVVPSMDTIAVATAVQLRALATYADGTTTEVTDSVRWTSSDDGIAAVASAGEVTAVSPGTVELRARSGSITGSALITVSDAVPQELELTPSALTLPFESSQQLIATATFSDGSRQQVTSVAHWTSADESLVSVSNESGSEGVATALAWFGTTRVAASFRGVSASAELDLVQPSLQALEVVADVSSLPVGIEVSLTAQGRYSNGNVADLSEVATWVSRDPLVVDVDEQGRIFAIAPGVTEVVASVDGLTAAQTITVTDAQLSSIAVTPQLSTVPVGLTVTLSAFGYFTDGSSFEISSSVAWSVSDPSILDLRSHPETGRALVTGLQMGAAEVAAVLSDPAEQSTATLTVASAVPVWLELSPVDPEIASGTELQLTAIAFYSDGSERDVTATATWSSSDKHVARLSNAAGDVGLVSAAHPGTATISAEHEGVSNRVVLSVF